MTQLADAIRSETPLLIAAPIATLSHRAFRELLLDFGGWDYGMTEMISAEALTNGTPFEASYTDFAPEPGRVIAQIVGYDRERILAAADRLIGRQIAGIDINMGCSAPKVYKRGGGARWPEKPDEAIALLHQLLELRQVWRNRTGEAGPALSVKLRLPRDGSLQPLRRFLDRLGQVGIDWATVHARRVGEAYSRPADWDAFDSILPSAPLPICLNGDITGPDAAERAIARFHPAAIMPGRALASKPWLPCLLTAGGPDAARGRRSAPTSYLETALRYHGYLEQYLPVEFWQTRARRFYAYFAKNFPFGHRLGAGCQSRREYPVLKEFAIDLVSRWEAPLPLHR